MTDKRYIFNSSAGIKPVGGDLNWPRYEHTGLQTFSVTTDDQDLLDHLRNAAHRYMIQKGFIE